MEESEKYYREGAAYYKTVMGAKAKGKEFGNQVYFNLIGLSLEGMLTGLIMRTGDLPEHSSIGSMFRMLKDQYDVPESFKEESRFLNRFMNYFCSLDVGKQEDPEDEDIERMLKFLTDAKEWIDQKISLN